MLFYTMVQSEDPATASVFTKYTRYWSHASTATSDRTHAKGPSKNAAEKKKEKKRKVIAKHFALHANGTIQPIAKLFVFHGREKEKPLQLQSFLCFSHANAIT